DQRIPNDQCPMVSSTRLRSWCSEPEAARFHATETSERFGHWVLVIHWSLRHWSLVICCGRQPTGNVEEPQDLVKQSSVVRFAVLAWLCAAAALAYVSRNAIAVAESTVRGDLGLTKEQSGWLMSAFFISYAAGQIPGAWIGQRFGARQALPAFAGAWSLA